MLNREFVQKLSSRSIWHGGQLGEPFLQARVIAEVGRILEVAARQGNACRDAADQLAYLHGELDAGHISAYDVASAVTVLRTGDTSARFQGLSVLAG